MDKALLTDWLRLIQAPGLGPATLSHLVRRMGGFAEVLTGTPAKVAAQVNGRAALRETLERFRHDTPLEPHAREVERLHAMGGRMLVIGEADYPPLLAAIHDPPPVLFTLGNGELLTSEGAVTVTGTRRASRTAVAFAHRLGGDLARHGVVTVSGLSSGIDAAAHRGALEADGPTVAVLVTGLDVVYPSASRELQQKIARTGCLVTESPLGSLPVPWLFPARSRILAGLSRGVVIVEAAERSGSLITARMALEQGREVFAVPGLTNDPKTRGTHDLLRQGARLTEGVEDVLAELNWPVRPPLAPPPAPHAVAEPAPLAGAEATAVLERISAGPMHEDELARCCQLTVISLSRILLQLELSGLVERLPGGRYVRVSGTGSGRP
ncbi:MAG: DNA-protecting protein DprA [Magnetococcales bacterium]|nr:DNA-protecting protein DprA [Magnetococcales bacterium]